MEEHSWLLKALGQALAFQYEEESSVGTWKMPRGVGGIRKQL